MSSVIYQSELARMSGLSEKSRSKIIAYCRRENIRFKYNWQKSEIYTTQKWLDDSETEQYSEGLEFGHG